jgi:hypothetical protein
MSKILKNKSPLPAVVPAKAAVRKLAISWISLVRPSRQPLCGLLRMRIFLMPIRTYLMLRSPQGASRSTHYLATAGLANLLTASKAGGQSLPLA